MAEKVTVRQSRARETSYTALDPVSPAAESPRAVLALSELTPYGMVLAALGTCTAFVLNSYADHHGVKGIEAFELVLQYERSYIKDCEQCAESERYETHINLTLRIEGPVAPEEQEKLLKVATHCPVHKLLAEGVDVNYKLA